MGKWQTEDTTNESQEVRPFKYYLEVSQFLPTRSPIISIVNKSFLHEHVVWYVIQQNEFIKFPKFVSQGH